MSDLAISFDSDSNIFFNRQAENGEMVQSLNVTKHESIMLLLPALVDVPDYADRLVQLLEAKGYARPNHKI